MSLARLYGRAEFSENKLLLSNWAHSSNQIHMPLPHQYVFLAACDNQSRCWWPFHMGNCPASISLVSSMNATLDRHDWVHCLPIPNGASYASLRFAYHSSFSFTCWLLIEFVSSAVVLVCSRWKWPRRAVTNSVTHRSAIIIHTALAAKARARIACSSFWIRWSDHK